MEDVNIFALYVIFVGGIMGFVVSLLAYVLENYKLAEDTLALTFGFVIGLSIVFLIYNGWNRLADYVNSQKGWITS